MYDLNRKIIFTHPPKCAGTTIEDIFGWRPKPPIDTNAYNKYNEFKHESLEGHITCVNKLGFDPFTFFKFSCVRNPWDRAVSFFFHDKYSENTRLKLFSPNDKVPQLYKIAETGTFEEYLDYRYKMYTKVGYNFLEIDQFINFNQKNILDYVVRYENLYECIDHLRSKYSIEDTPIPCHKQRSQRPAGIDYKAYYTNNKMIKIVEDLGKSSIDLFDYSFPK